MKIKFVRNAVLFLLCGLLAPHAISQAPESSGAKNAITRLQVTQQAGNVVVRVSLKQPPVTAPVTFSIANPPRIALDFPNTENALGRNVQEIGEGGVRSANIVQVGDRTRLVLNLSKMAGIDTRIEQNEVLISLSSLAPAAATTSGATQVSVAEGQRFAGVSASGGGAIRDVSFRRGKAGEGRVVVDLADPDTAIDIRQQGANLVAIFNKTTLPDHLRRRLDVTDFATAVTSVDTTVQGDNSIITITPTGLWEHNAYQSDNQFVIEVKRVIESPHKLVQGSRGGYQGEKLSLNFQNVDVRAVLQVIADFTNLNIITSDTVSGSLTLRLKDVPWDQALDIILQAKGLDMRKNGNVVWIAPRDELAAKEKLELETRQQVTDLEPVKTESFQLNYHKAKAIFDVLKNKDQTLLSKRGSVIVDERTNKLFVTDVSSRLDELRKLISEVDVPMRQVLIEARIVEAEDTFSRNLGARLGLNDVKAEGRRIGGSANNSPRFMAGGGLADTGFNTGQTSVVPDFLRDTMSVNLPANNLSGNRQPGQFSFILFDAAKSIFLNMEISALEADGKGKIISSPRVVTADQADAVIEQGVEIPYLQATSSGATSIAFRKANLTLKVKPQITPDGRVVMSLEINKDAPNTQLSTALGVAIDTKHVKTEVLVENGGTVVIGGIYTQDERTLVHRVPLLGELPVVGHLFKNTERKDNKTELLVFITPKIVNDNLTLR
ncbi:MAG: type IV pilus secretin PilQ [Pseudomonadota bacterium]